MALIGISGKKNSGKDLVYNIINYLYIKYKYPNIYKAYFLDFDMYLEHRKKDKVSWLGFENIKFANKLKDIVCLLIGCTREQLEDRDFKEKELGEEWRRWYWSYYKVSSDFNTKGKISGYFNSKEKAEEGKSDFKEILYKSDNWELKSEILTPRILLQEIGTDLFRNQLHSDIWVNSVFSNYKEINKSKNKQSGGLIPIKEYYKDLPNWIITDLRFKNELKAIKDRQGITIRINRYTDNVLINNDVHAVIDWQHPSETELDNETFDIVLNNDGTIEELVEQVDKKLFKNDVFRNLLL